MNAEIRMKALLRELDFDFSTFTMDQFVAWVEERKGRKIRFVSWDMPPSMFGVWMSDADEPVEHVFFDQKAPPLQAAHIQLHELAHILCDHPTARLTRVEMADLLHRGLQDPDVLQNALLRAPNNAECEQEAETLAALIQNQVIRHQRLQQLAVAASSNEALMTHFKALEFV